MREKRRDVCHDQVAYNAGAPEASAPAATDGPTLGEASHDARDLSSGRVFHVASFHQSGPSPAILESDMSGSDSSGSSGVDQAMSQALEKVRELGKSILEAAVDDAHVWFRNLLLGILNCALLDYRSVTIGLQKSIHLAAWGSRNLLELRVITTYVLASEGNANDFKNDLLIDAKEFYEAVSKSHRASHLKLVAMLSDMAESEEGPMKEVLAEACRRESERGPQTEASDSEAKTYKEFMANYGLKENVRPKRASEIAGLIRQKADFDPMFKICSKIMHRTALSIASSTMRGSLDEAIPFLSSAAACDLLSIYGSIDKHFGERGVQPPES